MGYKITLDQGVLRAELFDRETIAETKIFFRAVVSANKESGRPYILISVRSSKPIFKLEGLIEYLRELAAAPSQRIALLGDTRDVRLSHEYLEVIARQHGLNVRSFLDEAAARRWFEDLRGEQERRRQDRRIGQRRRIAARRKPS
jgi:hypothetical protein